MNDEIYQEIWDADQGPGGSGVPAIRHGSPKPAVGGFVEVSERESTSAEHRLFPALNIPDQKRETYRLCERLFNNYTLDPKIREQVTPGESGEETEFIEKIVQTPPLQEAKSGIAFDRNQPTASISDATLADLVRETWFFQGRAGAKHASGFEHVFVGEQKPTGDARDDKAVEAGGYHFWYKYFLDDAGQLLDAGVQGTDRITYGGTEYRGADNPEQGILIPEIVTLSFQWRAPDYTASDPTKTQLLKKPIGGFWVGCSPECLIALGVVRTLTRAGKLATINGVTYQLDLHRLTDNERSIRTFFPRFKKADFSGIQPPPGGGDGGGGSEDSGRTIPGRAVRLVAALVNPAGKEAGRESVTLINTTAASVDLTNWQIEAPNGTRLRVGEATISAGRCARLTLVTRDPVLRNRVGTIRLFDSRNQLQDTVDYDSDQAAREGSTIVFS